MSAHPDVDDLSDAPDPGLDERIEDLSAIVDDPAAGDVPMMLGFLADDLIARYDRDGDPADLTDAIERLDRAVALAPDHEERHRWWYCLGVGHRARGTRTGSRSDLDAAVAWLERLYADLPPDPDRDDVTIELLDAGMQRYWFVRYGDAATGDGAADRFLALAGRLALTGTDPEAVAYVGLLVGLGHLERFDLGHDAADRDAGIAGVGAALDLIEPGTRWREVAAAELVHALATRGADRGDRADLDRAVAIGRAIVDGGHPDDAWWASTVGYLSDALVERGTPVDLDDAVRYARLLDAEDDGLLYVAGAMVARAEASGEPAHIEAYARVVAELDATGSPAAAAAWDGLAGLHLTRWRRTADDRDLDEASRCADAAVGRPFVDSEDRLLAHNTRLSVMHEVFTRDSAADRDYDAALASARRARARVAEGLDALNRSPDADGDLRAMFAILIVIATIWLSHIDSAPLDVPMLRAVLDEAARAGTDPDHRAFLDAAAGMVDYWTDMQAAGPGRDRGVGRLAAATMSPDAARLGTDTLWNALVLAVQARGSGRGDIRSRRGSVDRLRDEQPGDAVVGMILAAQEDATRGDYGAMLDKCRRILDEFLALPERSVLRVQLGPSVVLLLSVASIATGVEFDVDLSAVPRPPGLLGDAIRVTDLMPELSAAVTRNDLGRMREIAAETRRAAGLFPPEHYLRLGAEMAAGQAHLEVGRRAGPGDPAAARAVEHFTAARSLAQRAEHPLWTDLLMGLAEALRIAMPADRPRSRAVGLAALHGLTWQVAVQSGTAYAAEAAARAARTAEAVAGWCLLDGAYDDLVAALDAGRGLVLGAAVAGRDVTDRLLANGHAELAGEWRDCPDADTITDDLRTRVLRALRNGPDTAGHLGRNEPVTVAEIRDSLRAVGSDALVYLRPAAGGQPGVAVVVSAAYGVQVVVLPGLTVEPGSPAHRFTLAGTGPKRDAEPVGAHVPAVSLDDICAWAWRAAVRDLCGLAASWRLDRPARIVLVPMGPLARIPWHAAYAELGGGARRYAAVDLAFSYAVSARMFQAVARHPPRRVESALVVGDPTGDLPGAGREARAIAGRLYPRADYYGRPASSARAAGTPDEVLAWINAGAPGPSLLHFACHGRADAREPYRGYLVLAGRARLTAEELLDACRLSALDIDQVFLAACTTGAPGDDYDESFSLATVFLAAGAHTVFGSLWPVDDADTSLLMFMVHHHLRADGCDPATALHRAQLWMIDPARTPPATMPEELAVLAARPALSDPAAWAAFTHQGR